VPTRSAWYLRPGNCISAPSGWSWLKELRCGALLPRYGRNRIVRPASTTRAAVRALVSAGPHPATCTNDPRAHTCTRLRRGGFAGPSAAPFCFRPGTPSWSRTDVK
jgi:hypothetical protein